MTISKQIENGLASGSWVRRMYEEAQVLIKQYGIENVHDLSLGNPIMEPPAEFKNELKRLADNSIPGMHRYMTNAGYPETREGIAQYLSELTGLPFTMNHIVMTVGAAGAANVVLKTLLNDGDEVVTFSPFFWEYYNYVLNNNGVLKLVDTDETFTPSLEALENAITAKTKVVLINTPNNPTGVVYSEETLKGIADVLKRKNAQYGIRIYLVSDEPYRKIIFDGLDFPPTWLCYPDSIVIYSNSKDLSLPGERIGYIAIHPESEPKGMLFDGLVFANRTLGFVNAPALMQRIVAKLQRVSVPVEEYQKKRDFLYGNLVKMGYNVVKPQGAFYMFPQAPIEDDLEFIEELMKCNVLATPGRGFGKTGYFRISYCVDDRTLEGCLEGFLKVAEKYNLYYR